MLSDQKHSSDISVQHDLLKSGAIVLVINYQPDNFTFSLITSSGIFYRKFGKPVKNRQKPSCIRTSELHAHVVKLQFVCGRFTSVFEVVLDRNFTFHRCGSCEGTSVEPTYQVRVLNLCAFVICLSIARYYVYKVL